MFKTRSRRQSAGPLLAVPFGRPAFRIAATSLLATSIASLAYAQQKPPKNDIFKPPTPVTYTEKYELYGGFSFLNGQAGQNLPKRYNMGGGEVMATWWLTPKFGIAGDARYDTGTTPMLPGGQATNPKVQTRPLASQLIGMGGVQYHWVGNHYAGINLHALAGVSHGNFDHSNPGLPQEVFTTATGLYSNRNAGMGVAGGSIDFNRSAQWAVRVSPEIVFEHFGTELREFFSISGGVIYRFGQR